MLAVATNGPVRERRSSTPRDAGHGPAAGAISELESAPQKQRDGAVQEERRRIARELHDGIAQELAYILGIMAAFMTAFYSNYAGSAELAYYKDVILLGRGDLAMGPLM